MPGSQDYDLVVIFGIFIVHWDSDRSTKIVWKLLSFNCWLDYFLDCTGFFRRLIVWDLSTVLQLLFNSSTMSFQPMDLSKNISATFWGQSRKKLSNHSKYDIFSTNNLATIWSIIWNLPLTQSKDLNYKLKHQFWHGRHHKFF